MKNFFWLYFLTIGCQRSFWMTAYAQTPAAPMSGIHTGSITGKVVTDDGQPLGKVQISLVGAERKAARALVQTDAEGNFNVPSLNAGVYAAYAQMPGYVQADATESQRYYRLGEFVALTLTKGGVITGRVEDENGEPLVKANVAAQRTRTLTGQPVKEENIAYRSMAHTDDRGVYRLYGLPPGSYRISARAADGFHRTEQLATYHPSSPRATATEVTVTSGSELAGIDIRLRKLTGFSVSGTVTGVKSGNVFSSTEVSFRHLTAQTWETSATVQDGQFSAVGITEGEYEIYAFTNNYAGDDQGLAAISQRVRVTVRGADVTGLALQMNALAAVKGRLVLEKQKDEAGKCAPSKAALAESLVSAQAVAKPNLWGQGSQATPDEQGKFGLTALEPGAFRWRFDLPAPTWYVRSISGGAAPLADQFTLKAGQTLDNVIVNVAVNAASLHGRVTTSAKLPERMRVHLIPADTPADNEDVWRYDETLVQSDGTFQFDHIAPGKYWLLTQPVAANEPLETQWRKQAWDAATRAQLRKLAEARKQVVELAACQRLSEFNLKF